MRCFAELNIAFVSVCKIFCKYLLLYINLFFYLYEYK